MRLILDPLPTSQTVNNNIEYGLFEDIIDRYYLDSQIKDDFVCTKTCWNHKHTNDTLDLDPQCTHV